MEWLSQQNQGNRLASTTTTATRTNWTSEKNVRVSVFFCINVGVRGKNGYLHSVYKRFGSFGTFGGRRDVIIRGPVGYVIPGRKARPTIGVTLLFRS